MERQYFIDVFKDNLELKEYAKKRGVKYEFVNMLFYCKERYELTIVDLATIFQVHRQTIYNYKDTNTNDLPESIKATFVEVYEANNFNEVLDFELLFELESEDYKSMIERNEISEECLNEVPYYTMEYDKYIGAKAILKDKYNYGLKLHNILRERKEEKEETKNLAKLFEHISKNSNRYNELLSNLLFKTTKDDYGFLNYIEKYFNEKLVVINSDYNKIDLKINISDNAKTILLNNKHNFKYSLSSSVYDTKYLFDELDKIDIKDSNLIVVDIIYNQEMSNKAFDSDITKIKKTKALINLTNIISGFKYNYDLSVPIVSIYIYK